MTIFEELRADHDKQRTLIDLLVKTKGDSEGRASLLERVSDALRRHAIAEERHFYVPLIQQDMTQEKARHSVAEHKELDDYLEELESTDFSSSGWLATARKLEERLLHHLEEEEKEVFPVAGRVLNDKQKASLARSYREEMESRRQEEK